MRHLISLLAVLACLSSPVTAGQIEPSWPEIRASLFDQRTLTPAEDAITLNVPYRTPDDARADIGGVLVPPGGRRIGRVFVILDENPMPVSALFTFDRPVPAFNFEVTMRVNGPTPVHVVMETTDSQLYVAETFVKTSGTGACAAPPGTDPLEALATLGNIDIEIGRPGEGVLSDPTSRGRQVDVDIRHPSHSGMQMDQISLLFIPMRYVDKVDIDLNGEGYVSMEGSISLSENPGLKMGVPANTGTVGVTMTDTDGTISREERAIADF